MKVKRRVLIFIDWFLPGYKAGGPIQSCANLVNHLKDDYEFYIATRNTDYCSDTPYTSVISDAWNDIDGVKSYYFSKSALGYSNLKKLICDVAPDVVYINGIYSFYFSLLPLLLAKQLKHKDILVAGRGMFASSAIKVKGYRKSIFFFFAKTLKFYKGITFHATNQTEADDIHNAIGRNHSILIAPNLSKKIAFSIKDRRKESGTLRLINIARISPEKNLKYALEILAGFKETGSITFDIYGPVYNQAYWQECQTIIASMPQAISVNYKGSLESDRVAQVLLNYHALFLPTQGENFGHVILESLAAGCPVLISNQTPWKQLKGKGIGFDIPLTDNKAFHDALSELLTLDQEQFNSITDKAYTFALQYIRSQENIEMNKALFI